MTKYERVHFYPEVSDLLPADEVLLVGTEDSPYLTGPSLILDTVEVSEDLTAIFAINATSGELIEPFLAPKTTPVELKPPF